MKKALFIIPYFGKFSNTFPYFLKTCALNPDFNWLIVTDDQFPYPFPENVAVQYTQFDKFVQKVQSFFDFPIAIPKPYKICDYRAAFGVIFADELADYQFWGHCDTDQFFGKINHFITDDILTQYDKILCLGHFSLFRNCPRINNLYLQTDQKTGQNFQDISIYLI